MDANTQKANKYCDLLLQYSLQLPINLSSFIIWTVHAALNPYFAT